MTTSERGEPEILEEDDAYVCLWHGAGYGIAIDNVREGSDGIHGEIRVRTTTAMSNGKTGHALLARLNLLSTQMRTSAIRTLAERIPGTDWASMVEYACVVAVQRFRRGEPAVDLADVDASDDVPYLLRGIVPEGETTVMFAAGGSAKSYLALAACVACVTGETVGGLFVPERQCNALYLDYETRHETHARRLAWMCRGLGYAQKVRGVYYRRLHRSIAEEVRSVRMLIRERKIGLVVVDSLGPASGGEQDKADATIRALNSMRVWGPGVTVLVISHVTKQSAEQERGQAKPFGSVFVENLARQCWEVRRGSYAGGSMIDIALFCTKINEGEPPPALGVRLTWDLEAKCVRIARTDLHDDPELSAHGSAADRILAYLREGAKPATTVAQDTGLSVNTARSTLRRLLQSGQVQVLGGGKGRGESGLWSVVNG